MKKRILAAALVFALVLPAVAGAPKVKRAPTCDERLARVAIISVVIGFFVARQLDDDADRPASPFRP